MKWRAICINRVIVADEVGDTEDDAVLNAKVEAEANGYNVDELDVEVEVLNY